MEGLVGTRPLWGGGFKLHLGQVGRTGLWHPLAPVMAPSEFIHLLSMPPSTPCRTMLCLSRQRKSAYCMQALKRGTSIQGLGAVTLGRPLLLWPKVCVSWASTDHHLLENSDTLNGLYQLELGFCPPQSIPDPPTPCFPHKQDPDI